MLKKASVWAAVVAVAVIGLSLAGGSVAFAGPGCPGTGDPPPCGGPASGGGPPSDPPGNGDGRHGAFGVVSERTETPLVWKLLTKQGPVDITMDGSTVCKDGTPGSATAAKCANILDGQYVSVQGTPDGDGGILAKRVNLNRGRSLHEHCTGVLTKTGDDTFTVACLTDGTPFVRSFEVDGTKFIPASETLDSLSGHEVMVVAVRDSLTDTTYDAKVVHKVAE